MKKQGDSRHFGELKLVARGTQRLGDKKIIFFSGYRRVRASTGCLIIGQIITRSGRVDIEIDARRTVGERISWVTNYALTFWSRVHYGRKFM